MLLSLIIPIYKVEQYIKECLDSMISQLPLGIEIILVNDGTPDSSMQVVHNILVLLPQQVRQQFIIYEQENQGLSAARNSGLHLAKGKYIAFLDSDDVLLPNYFSTILSIIRKYDIDIIQFKFLRFFEDISKIIPYHLYLSKQGEYKLDNDLLCEIFNDNAWYAWSRIYKAELFKEINFPVGYNFEDAATIPYLMLRSKSVFLVDQKLYGYRDRPDSIVRSVSTDVIQKNMRSIAYLVDRFSESAYDNRIFFIVFVHFFRLYINYSLQLDGVVIARQRWKKFSPVFEQLSDYRFLITKPANKLFVRLYRFGLVSLLMVNFLVAVYDVLLRVRQLLVTR